MNEIQFKRCEKCCVEGMYNRDDILCPNCDSELILLSLVPAQDLARITAERDALIKEFHKMWRPGFQTLDEVLAAALKQSS